MKCPMRHVSECFVYELPGAVGIIGVMEHCIISRDESSGRQFFHNQKQTDKHEL